LQASAFFIARFVKKYTANFLIFKIENAADRSARR